jgi:hypothetical protein
MHDLSIWCQLSVCTLTWATTVVSRGLQAAGVLGAPSVAAPAAEGPATARRLSSHNHESPGPAAHQSKSRSQLLPWCEHIIDLWPVGHSRYVKSSRQGLHSVFHQ